LVGLASIGSNELRDLTLYVATWIYGTAQGLTGFALVFAMAVVWHQGRKARKEQRLARLGFLYLPFALFSGVGALVWAATLATASFVLPKASLEQWAAAYLSKLIYDLAFTEALLAAGVALGGILLLLPAHALFRKDRGALVHTRLLFALKIFPFISAVFIGDSSAQAQLLFRNLLGFTCFAQETIFLVEPVLERSGPQHAR
jgi:hypothetical protein